MNLDLGTISVRSLTQHDKHLLVKWLSDPSVLAFYEGRDNPYDLKRVDEHFFQTEKNVQRCIVTYQNTPIGYIQYYLVTSETSKLNLGTGRHFGMDLFIGERDFWNKGIGTKLVQGMVDYLIAEEQADQVIVDPQITNKRAIRCYEKCGFQKVNILSNHEYHEGGFRDCWLMVCKSEGG
ncbi:GNAT family N-acetyltransferase [Lentibacillus saliphilus]|uniref:GNAT family N-acetyltransferase n=1 Tax=Lentibacillus saliphilus TaxID=2737028 RepID=UPI0031B9FB44